MEVTGLVLGILPILISALEHYDEILKPFIRYRHFSSRFRDYNDELEVHRTIFRTECIILLGTATTKDTAAAMLNDFSHESWNDMELKTQLDNRLGSLRPACESTIQKIKRKIEEISSKSKEFDSIVASSTSTDPKMVKEWRNIVGKKLKFSLRSDKTIHKSLEELSRLNSVFRILSSQVTQLELQWQPLKGTQDRGEMLKDGVDQIRTVREASVSLYEYLSRLCTKHDGHATEFSLIAVSKTWPSKPKGHHVQFDLRWLGPIHDMHETSVTRNSRQVQHSVSVSNTIDTMKSILRHPDMRLDIESIPQHSSPCPAPVSIEDSNSISPPLSQGSSGLLSGGIDTTFDLCASLNIPVQADPTTSLPKKNLSDKKDVYTLLTGTAGSFRHLVRASYGTEISDSPSHSHQSRSLANMLSLTTKTGRQTQLPQLLRLYLAKVLSNTTLQYYETPWLAQLLQSDGVFLTEPVQSTMFFQDSCVPFIEVQLETDKCEGAVNNPMNVPSESPRMNPNFPTIIPNDTLYHLGVLLLELAYNWPFASLVSEVREDAPILVSSVQDEKTTEFLIAQYLAEDVGTKMGATYAEVVKKCLRCDFGSGNDLNQLDLQKAVFDNVLCKLEELETGIRKAQNQAVRRVHAA